VLDWLRTLEAGVDHIIRKVHQMADELRTLDEAIAKIEDDAVNIAANVEETRLEVATLRAQVAELLLQIEAGTPATVEQLNDLTDRVNAVDEALDAIVPDPVEEPPIEEPPIE